MFPALLALALNAAADSKQPQKNQPPERIIEGTYICVAKDGDKTMTGTVEVRKVRATYLVSWDYEIWKFEGVAIRQGDTLAISWAVTSTAPDGAEKKFLGIHLMTMQGDGAAGCWQMVPGYGRTQSETWSGRKDLPPPVGDVD